MSDIKCDMSNYKRLTIDRLNEDGCINMLSYFLKNMSEEFQASYFSYLRDKKNKDALKHYTRMREFYLSDYFTQLTNLDGRMVLQQLEKSYEDSLAGALQEVG